MAVDKHLDSIVWCNDPWDEPPISEEARRLLRECCDAHPPDSPDPPLDAATYLQELIDNSKRFPIPFPVHTVRLEKLKLKTPAERLVRNAQSTYPLMNQRVLVLMANFLIYKRIYGSNIEKEMYKEMSIPQLIERILQKRAITFMKAQDQYKLITGEKGVDGWESVGTESEQPPLVLSQCLSYDEMKLSALVYVSGYTECINDGARRNAAAPAPAAAAAEREAVIIGVIGPRFKRVNRMGYEDIVVTKDQNRSENGYGESNDACPPARRAWIKLWADFYQLPSMTHDELYDREQPVPCTSSRMFSTRWASVKGLAFDNTAYYRRLQLILDTCLVEANHRAREADKFAFLNIIGAGLGVWKLSPHQVDVFVLAALLRARHLLGAGALPRVADVNLAYIKPGKHVAALFESSVRTSSGNEDGDVPLKLFLKNKDHPKGGINVQLQNREPSSQLRGEHEGKLLVLTYPWDGNAHPGNEFWVGKLTSSGDPAAACATQVAELHNARVNRRALRAPRTALAAPRAPRAPRPCTLPAHYAALLRDRHQ
ncbi:unnamed protein product [Diatraea saccharalis]|uniref:Uncharacterized protein n=1 Tax=Diatraea saccharalis TaxID=40085 RepID=A0A9N9RA49_9NEOP|nr:unnamed protein product [Diatraea saccharalis]